MSFLRYIPLSYSVPSDTSKTHTLVGYSVVYRLPHITIFNSANLFHLPFIVFSFELNLKLF